MEKLLKEKASHSMRKMRTTIAILNVNKCVSKNSSKSCQILFCRFVNKSIRLFCVCVFSSRRSFKHAPAHTHTQTKAKKNAL